MGILTFERMVNSMNNAELQFIKKIIEENMQLQADKIELKKQIHDLNADLLRIKMSNFKENGGVQNVEVYNKANS